MPLVQCPDCNRHVSDLADACPQCGRPMIPAYDAGSDVAPIAEYTPAPSEPGGFAGLPPATKILIAIVVGFILYGIIDARGGPEDAPAVAPSPSAMSQAGQPVDAARAAAAAQAAQAAGGDMAQMDPGMMPPGGAPMPDAPSQPRNAKERALQVVRMELSKFVMMQEIHYNETMTYAKSTSELRDYTGAMGVHLSVVNASNSGYGVTASHEAVPGMTCAFYVGSSPPLPPPPTAAQVYCNGG